jgi:putative protease
MPEQQVGTVTHYFNGPQVAVVKLDAGELNVGDEVRFTGHTSDFRERITSMEIDHVKVEHAKAGQEIAIQVEARVRQHDKVLKIT